VQRGTFRAASPGGADGGSLDYSLDEMQVSLNEKSRRSPFSVAQSLKKLTAGQT
jgi:hypothetical protein